MILLKTLSSKSTPPRPLLLQRTLSSLPPQQQETPKPETLSSLFAKPDTKPRPDKPPPKPIRKREELKKKKESVLRYGPMEEKEPPKELSADAASLLARLTADGYLKDANFLKGKEEEEELEAAAHRVHIDYYARSFYRLAAERFGTDQQEIAQWLSGKDLKTIALFGCPSIERKSVFAAKRLRSFFHIHEDNVCQTCKLSASCHFKNQKVGAVDKVILGDVMRLIMVYTMNSVPKVLSVPDNLKCSVEKVLKEVIRLCG